RWCDRAARGGPDDREAPRRGAGPDEPGRTHRRGDRLHPGGGGGGRGAQDPRRAGDQVAHRAGMRVLRALRVDGAGRHLHHHRALGGSRRAGKPHPRAGGEVRGRRAAPALRGAARAAPAQPGPGLIVSPRRPGRETPSVRTLTDPADVDAGLAVFRTAMVGMRPRPPHPEGDVFTLVEKGRMVGGFIGDQLVGAADSTTGELTVPGGARLAHAAVTRVGVLPTHTRRGVLSALMRAQLGGQRDRGVAVATLRASEGTIYGRFGYAVASELRTLRIEKKDAVLRPEVAAAVDRGAVRLVDAEDQALPQRIVTAVPAARPGTITRGDQWWNSRRLWAEATPGPRYLAVHGAAGAEDGYVRYRPADTAGWFTSPERTVIVEELYAPSAAARRDLLAFLLGLDLVDVLELPDRPVD